MYFLIVSGALRNILYATKESPGTWIKIQHLEALIATRHPVPVAQSRPWAGVEMLTWVLAGR